MNADRQFDFDDHWEPPRRSRLVTVKPRGAGTGLQEAMTSLILRVAGTHTVKPMDLINREIIPRGEIHLYKHSGSFVRNHAKTINGLGKYATELVLALEELTCQEDLIYCSFLPWLRLLAPNGNSLLHFHPHWCPACFSSWKKDNEIAYFPLLWFCERVQVCHIHQCPLQSRCPSCSSHQPFVGKHAYLDCCSYCGGWLGSQYVRSGQPDHAEDLPQRVKEASWIAEMIWFVQSSAESASLATRERLSESLKAVIGRHFEGSQARFDRQQGLPAGTSERLIRGETAISLKSLVRLGNILDTSPVSLLRSDLVDVLKLPPPRVQPKTKQRHRLSDDAFKALREKLLSIARETASKALDWPFLGSCPLDHPSFVQQRVF